jgi:hypothetical protein
VAPAADAEGATMDMAGKPHAWRRKRLERELLFWRVIGLAAIAALCFGFTQSSERKDIRLVSPDGTQSVEITPFGISLVNKGKTLGRIGFETIGDGDDQEVLIKLTGQVVATAFAAQNGTQRLFLDPERIGFLKDNAVRAALQPDGLLLQDKTGRAKIDLVTPEQGWAGIDFVEDGKLILAFGSLAKLRGGEPPRRDAGAIHIGDFGKDAKSRLITAGDSELHTTH